jgi:hypothetical protein
MKGYPAFFKNLGTHGFFRGFSNLKEPSNSKVFEA